MSLDLGSRYHGLVQSLITLLEARNPFNVDHCKLVAHYSQMVGERAKLPTRDLDLLRSAAEIHTLGVLLQMEEKKPHQSLPITRLGFASGREQSIHQREESILQAVLTGTPYEPCIPIIVQRHEWFDGSASIMGLAGNKILPAARALAVADAFVDLATPKSHRDPLSTREVLERIEAQSGTQFDPSYVKALVGALEDEEGRWGAVARARRLETSRCRHWLGLGYFHAKTGETDWALRCFLAAQKLAKHMADADLEMDAIYGQFSVFCSRGELERARDLLQQSRQSAEEREDRPRLRMQQMWGWLEWSDGREDNGYRILQDLSERYEHERDLPGVASVQALQATMLLARRGFSDPEHRRWLERFMALVAKHDLFDVVEQLRPQTIPLLMSAALHAVEPLVARSLLTRMGEPCPTDLTEELIARQVAKGVGRPQAVEPAAPKTGRRSTDVRPLDVKTAIRVHLLGRFRLEFGGKVVVEEDWPTQKAMKLFAYLAYRRGNSASDETVMDMFWPESDIERARNSLRNALHQIRTVLRSLGSEPQPDVEHSRKTRALTLKMEYFLDTEALESAVTQATSLLASHNAEAALRLLQSTIALVRGDFLEGNADEWLLGIRTHLAEVHLRALHLQTRCYLALKDAEAAELSARKSLGYDDLREDLHADLIEALTDQGRRAEALRHYQEASENFRKELGLVPGSLIAVYDRLLREFSGV
jgi:DNA-binding SARP family transcriptional activator